jgi:hypothetical protein
MQVHSNPMEEYARAVALEKAAWEAVRHRLPGCAAFDETLWQRWRQAVDEADHAASRAKAQLSAVPTRLPLFLKALPQAIRRPPIFNRGTHGPKA